MKFPWTTLVKLIAFALCSLLVLDIMWNTLNNSTSGKTYTYSAEFADASGLHSGDGVRVAGVVVGKVLSIELGKDNAAEVRFRVQASHELYTNTDVLIRYENLIGQRYLALQPAQNPGQPLPDGAAVPPGHTEGALDLSVLMNGFQPLFSVLSPQDINKLAGTIIQVFQGEGATLSDLLNQIGAVSGDLAQHDRLIGRVITNLGAVVSHLAAKDGQFGSLIVQTRHLVEGLAADRHVIGSSIDGIGALVAGMNDLLVRTRPGLKADRVKANTVLGIYAKNKDLLRRTLDVTGDFFTRTAGIAQYGSWGNTYVCQLGLAPGVDLTPLTQLLLGSKHSEVCR